MRHRLSAFAVLVVVLLSAGSCAHRPAAVAERPADLTVFFTSDTRGMLRRCGCSEGQLGGLSARASYLKGHRVEGRTLVLDAGDSLFDGMDYEEARREFYTLKGRTIYRAMGQCGYDAAAFGEYDFAYGWDLLYDTARVATFPFLAANVKVDTGGAIDKAWYTDSFIEELSGVRVGVIGVMDPAFPYGGFKRSFRGVSVSDPVTSARDNVKMRGKADIVIVLAHLSVTDPEVFTKALPEADVVIQGHSGETLEAPVRVGKTLLVKGFSMGKRIGRLDIRLDKGEGSGRGTRGRAVIKDYAYSVIDLDESIPTDPEVEEILADYRKTLKERLFVSQYNDPPGEGHYIGPEICKGCHAEQYRNWSGTAHARSYPALVKTGDQFDPECLPCHTTGYGYMSGFNVLTNKYPNVTCESCHGRGSLHAGSGAAVLIKKQVDEGACRKCHDEYQSPKFDYEKYKDLGGAHKPSFFFQVKEKGPKRKPGFK